MKIDAHQHFWQFEPVRDAWIDDSMQVLQRDYLPSQLQPLLEAHGFGGCVAVQASQSEEETVFLLGLAEKHGFIKAVVGWLDLMLDDIEERLAYFSQFPKLAGLRHIAQGEPDVNFLLRDKFRRGIAALGRHGYTYDILVFPHQLGAALELVRRFPAQRFVLDHMAKPYVKDGYRDGWTTLMREMARHDHVFCKVSGLATEADWQDWRYEDFVPYLDCVVGAFGTQRLMFGSDWPVCLLAGSYGKNLSIAERYFESFSASEKAQVFGGNAAAFYRIPAPKKPKRP